MPLPLPLELFPGGGVWPPPGWPPVDGGGVDGWLGWEGLPLWPTPGRELFEGGRLLLGGGGVLACGGLLLWAGGGGVLACGGLLLWAGGGAGAP